MATEPTNGTIDDELAKRLHLPGRIKQLENLEEHLLKATRLSRALWMALCNEDLSLEDERAHYALMELASEVADHARAAEYVFQKAAAARVKA